MTTSRPGIPSNPNGEPLTLDRWHAERRDHHRALLLWAMQGPDMRSQRKVSKATGTSEGSIRNWKRTRMWEARVQHHGKHADQYALDLYRTEYMMDYGRIELPWVLPNVVRSVGVDLDDPTAIAAEQARERARKATGATVAEVEQAVRQTVADRKRTNRSEADKHIRLVDGALGLLARKMKANEIRVSVRDIPVLLECRERLARAVAGGEAEGAGRVVQSSRVLHAKDTGGDVLQAMYEDAEEVVLILGALRTKRTEDVHALSQQDAEHREQAGT
jgi:hypothetical protein